MLRSSALMVADQEPRAPDRQKQHIIDLLAGYSIELTPAIAAKYTRVADLLPAGTRVYVAFVPGDDYRVVAATAKRLRAEGLVPVPHFPARSISDRAALDDYLARVTGEAGVDEVLAIGGGLDQPQGGFSGTLDLLETGLFEVRGVRVIGVAGHPEGQRELRLPGVAMSLDQKLGYAERSTARMRLVTQFLFDADPLLAWERTIRAHGNPLPIHVGVPGPAKITTLLNYARLCGVGNSMRMLTRQTGSLFKLASVSCPDVLLCALAAHRADTAESRVERVHVYPFGGLARTAAWIEAVRAGRFTMNQDGRGFTVEAPIE